MRLAGLIWLVACGGISADHPLTIPLGLPRAQADQELKKHEFCHPPADGPRPPIQSYQRCGRAGTDWGETWVVAKYDDDRLVELRRYERFTDQSRATERWNQLVAARAKLSPPSPDATRLIREHRFEPGTKSVQAFHQGDAIVGVYLLDPQPPENASILEAIIRLPAE